MAIRLRVDADGCPYCGKSWDDHASTKTLCSKVQRSINRLVLIRNLAEQSALTFEPRDMASIADICGMIIKELEE